MYDAKDVEEAFGLPPEKVVDVMAIWGDAIDNIPGVPGIGEKGAKALIQQFGSLEGVYENLDQIKRAAQRKSLEDNRDKAFLSRDLAKIKCDLELDIDFDALTLDEPDRAKLHDVFSRLEFASLMQEYLPEAPPVEKDFRIAASGDDIREFSSEGAPPLSEHLVRVEDAGWLRRADRGFAFETCRPSRWSFRSIQPSAATMNCRLRFVKCSSRTASSSRTTRSCRSGGFTPADGRCRSVGKTR